MIRKLAPWPILLALAASAAADEFDRLEGRALVDIPMSPGAKAREAISVTELSLLPAVLKDARSALVVVKTDQGNPARMLVSPGLRKPPGGGGEPVPILVVERFDTFEAGPATTRLAHGRDLVLFDRFRLDLDTGQVVPEGQGGDLRFEAGERPDAQRIVAEKPAAIYTLEQPPPAARAEPGKPSPGRSVLPRDFDGRYRLVANGQWSGLLELESGDRGVITGRFRSDQTGQSYRVSGQVEPGDPSLIRFSVVLPRARQEFEGRLFTEGKGAIAGTMSLLERGFGFFATREGGVIAPEGMDLGDAAGVGGPGRELVIEVPAEGPIVVDGKPIDEPALAEALRGSLAGGEVGGVLVRASADAPYGRLARLVEILDEVGAARVRFAASGSDGR